MVIPFGRLDIFRKAAVNPATELDSCHVIALLNVGVLRSIFGNEEQ
jgi:hypothetical protein